MAKGGSGNVGWALAGASDLVRKRMPLGSLPRPEAPLLHLWYLDLERLSAGLMAVVGGVERDKEGAGAAMSPQQLRLARRFYLRMLLGAYLGVAGKDVALIRGPRGKPVVDAARHPGPVHFSMAKSGGRLLIGVSGSNEVGVDLEVLDRRPRNAVDLARRFFSAAEAGAICDTEPGERDAAFMRLWACKEAVVKASGHGIANRFCRFTVAAPKCARPAVLADRDHPAEGWRIALLLPEARFLAAVAVQQPELEVKAFRLG